MQTEYTGCSTYKWTVN